MRDEDVRLMELLRRDLEDIRWLDAAEVRAVARRRGRLRAMAVAVAVVVLSIPVVAVAKLPQRQGVPAGDRAAAMRAEIPLDALLQPEDLSVKVDEPFTEAGLARNIVIEPEWSRCLQERAAMRTWETSRYSRSQFMMRPDGIRSEDDSGHGYDVSVVLSQDIYRIGPELVATFFAGVEQRIELCRDWATVESGMINDTEWADLYAVQRWTALDRDFAGDESILIRHTVGETRRNDADGEVLAAPMPPESIAVVRVGDLVTVVNVGSGESAAELRRLAVIAAGRLCVAANPPC